MPAPTAPEPVAATAAPPRALRRVPERTLAGQSELVASTRALSQRQRTLLFLVDGARSVDELHELAQRAGAGPAAFSELLALGMIALPPPLADPAPPDAGDAPAASSTLPSSQSLHGDSRWSVLDEGEPGRIDRPLDEARSLLMRAVRSESPVAGTLTLLRLKRAATREALEALLDEVEQRLRKPHRRVIAAQMLRHVRHLLTLPPATQPPPAA